MLLIVFYIFVLSFLVLLIIIHFAPEYIEKEDGSMVPREKKNLNENLKIERKHKTVYTH